MQTKTSFPPKSQMNLTRQVGLKKEVIVLKRKDFIHSAQVWQIEVKGFKRQGIRPMRYNNCRFTKEAGSI